MQALHLLRKYRVPQNAFVVEKLKFVPNFKELRLSWTANALMSEGMERFVDEYLPTIRKNNPQVTYHLHRTHVYCDPFLHAIFQWNRERKMRCSWAHELKILAFLEEMAIGGDFRPGKKRRVSIKIPRGQQIWDIETKGQDVYKVYSKWKGDPPDPNAIPLVKHPTYIVYPLLGKRKIFRNFDE